MIPDPEGRFVLFDDIAAPPSATESAAPAASAPLIFTMRQAKALVKFFGDEDAEVCVINSPTDTAEMAAGLYAYMREYPEEGSHFLGRTEVADDEIAAQPPATGAAAPAASDDEPATVEELERHAKQVLEDLTAVSISAAICGEKAPAGDFDWNHRKVVEARQFIKYWLLPFLAAQPPAQDGADHSEQALDMVAQDGDVPMPELPSPDVAWVDGKDEYGYDTYDHAYSAEQMQEFASAYGNARVAAALASAGKPSGQDAIDAAMLDALKACEQFLRVLGLDSKPAAEVAEKARAAIATREAAK
jgi:hypothetical protein